MCNIQENNNKNLVIEVADKAIEKLGERKLIYQIHQTAHKLRFEVSELVNEGGYPVKDFAEDIAKLEASLDILKHHYNIGREVTAAKTNHLNALKTLIK